MEHNLTVLLCNNASCELINIGSHDLDETQVQIYYLNTKVINKYLQYVFQY